MAVCVLFHLFCVFDPRNNLTKPPCVLPAICHLFFYLSVSTVLAATAARGIDLSIIRHLGELLTNAGFENAETDFVSCPMGWQGRLGDLSLKTTTLSFKALKSTVGSIMGVSDEEYERILEEIFDGFRRKKSWVDAPYALAWKPKRRKK